MTTALALVLAAGAFALQDRRPAMHKRSVRVSIADGAFGEDGQPRPRSELLAFITQTILAPARMDEVIGKHDLVRKLGAKSPQQMRAGLAERVEIDVGRSNAGFADAGFADAGFADIEASRQRLASPRALSVTLTFADPDPVLALAVARDLGEILAETQTARVDEAVNARIEDMRVLAENAAGRAVRLEARLHQTRQDAGSQPSVSTQELLQRFSAVVRAAQEASTRAAADLVDAQLQVHAAGRPRDLVQVLDAGTASARKTPPAERLLRQVLLSLLVAGIAALLLVGALDATVRDGEDLRRAGWEPLGRVPLPRIQSSRADI